MKIQYFSGSVYFLGERQGFAYPGSLPIGTIPLDSFLVAALQLCLVEFQRFFLRSFRGVGHIAFMRFFHAIDSAGRATADEDLTEE